MNTFEKIYEVVKAIPKGRVATYGQVAMLAGNIRWASRRRTIRTRPKALKTGFFFVVAYRHTSYCRTLKP